MRFEESRQSPTSPLKYRLELSPKEVEKVKDLIYKIIKRIKEDEKN
jgi:hypothetical protein|tara:strand:- start:56 stop:193 length:138 start_codon:yes stop_codon:yes gene_type:complete